MITKQTCKTEQMHITFSTFSSGTPHIDTLPLSADTPPPSPRPWYSDRHSSNQLVSARFSCSKILNPHRAQTLHTPHNLLSVALCWCLPLPMLSQYLLTAIRSGIRTEHAFDSTLSRAVPYMSLSSGFFCCFRCA